jgi:hypothetical protein
MPEELPINASKVLITRDKIMERQEIITQFHELYSSNSTAARELIKRMDYKMDHRLLQLIALSYVDEASFTVDGRTKEVYDRRKLRYAERYILKAFQIRPICSNVLWTMAKVKKDYGQYDSAIFCYSEIIKLGVSRICRDSCRNTIDVARSQINDSRFELYRLYHNRNPKLSRLYLTLYKKGIRSGIHSLYKPLIKYIIPEFLGRSS